MEDKIASLRREIAKNNDDIVTSPMVNKTRLESALVVDALDKISVPTECELLLPYGMVRRRCANGRIHPFGNGIVHSTPLQKDYVKGMHFIVLFSGQGMPFLLLRPPTCLHPSKKMQVLPPNKLPLLWITMSNNTKKKQAAKRLPTIAKRATQKFVTPKKLQGILIIRSWYSSFTSNKFVEEFHVESELDMFGSGRIETYIRHDVIIEMLNSEELNINCILWYQIVSHSIFATNGVNRCAYINPQSITETECVHDEQDKTNQHNNRVVTGIAETMNFHQKFFFFPHIGKVGFNGLMFVESDNSDEHDLGSNSFNCPKISVDLFNGNCLWVRGRLAWIFANLVFLDLIFRELEKKEQDSPIRESGFHTRPYLISEFLFSVNGDFKTWRMAMADGETSDSRVRPGGNSDSATQCETATKVTTES
ncbi:unnamed protein product [Lactuca saligna]|uniref:Uncharacterized protein n=1 Tax=Lactuca saligna TaxID=75948 RepID=A0AA35YK35_LACSI|nr:unnamed protein product [Lactuca saligna]